MPIFAIMVIMRIPKDMMFMRSSLFFISPKEGRKLANMVTKKMILTNFASCSWSLDISVVRSAGSFIAIAINVMEITLMVKNLHGNQSFHCRNPWKTSNAIARVQNRDAIPAYKPIHGIASSGDFLDILLDRRK